MGRFDEATDAELLASGPGVADAFDELYQRHVEAVLQYFMRRTGCAQTAADLTSETFAQALTSRHRFRDVGAPGRAWLFTIARRQLGRFVRREQVADRARRKLGIEPIALNDVDLERVERLVDLEPLRKELDQALQALPAGQADALRLRVAQGLGYPEIASRLGCSEGAARVRVSRGLTTLADTPGGSGMTTRPDFIDTLGEQLRAGAERLEGRRTRRRRALAGATAVVAASVIAVAVLQMTDDPAEETTTAPETPISGDADADATTTSVEPEPTETTVDEPEVTVTPTTTLGPELPIAAGEIQIVPDGPYRDGQSVELHIRPEERVDLINAAVRLCAIVDDGPESCDPARIPQESLPRLTGDSQGVTVSLPQRHFGPAGSRDCADPGVRCRLRWAGDDGHLLTSPDLDFVGTPTAEPIGFSASPSNEPGVIEVAIDGLTTEGTVMELLSEEQFEQIAEAFQPAGPFDVDALTLSWSVSAICAFGGGEPPIGFDELVGATDWWQPATLLPPPDGSPVRWLGPNCEWFGESAFVDGDGVVQLEADRDVYGFSGWSDCAVDACYVELSLNWSHPEAGGQAAIGGGIALARTLLDVPDSWPTVRPSIEILEPGPFAPGDEVTVELRNSDANGFAIAFCTEIWWRCGYFRAERDGDVWRLIHTVPEGCEPGRCYYAADSSQEGLAPPVVAVLPVSP